MGRYFNKTRGPVTVSLRTGEAVVVGPKRVLEVTPVQDRSASLLSRVRKGLLIKLPDAEPPNAAPPVFRPVSEPSATTSFAESRLDTPSLAWTKSRLMTHAESIGLAVSSSWSKVHILEAIEAAE